MKQAVSIPGCWAWGEEAVLHSLTTYEEQKFHRPKPILKKIYNVIIDTQKIKLTFSKQLLTSILNESGFRV